MSSGPIFVAIVVIWAAVLVPKGLRAYERSATDRTTRRFQRAMGALGAARLRRPVDVMLVRRAAAPAGVPLGSAVDLHLDQGVTAFDARDDDALGGDAHSGDLVYLGAPEVPRTSAATIRRRRRAYMVLVGVLALVLGMVLAGLVSSVALGVPMAAIGAYVGLTRIHLGARERERHVMVLRARATRAVALEAEQGFAPVPAAIRAIEGSVGAASPGADVRVLAGEPRRGVVPRGLRTPGSWTTARVLELDEALAATYIDEEQRLGLDDYVGTVRPAFGRVVNG